MSDAVPIADWPRPDFVEPTSARAEVLFLIVGASPGEGMRVSRERHRVDRLEPALVISRHQRSDDPAWFDGWFAQPLGDRIDETFGAQAARVRAASQLTVVRGQFEDSPSLNYLRNTIGIVSAILESADGAEAPAVFDAMAVRWWPRRQWIERFVDRGGEFDVHDHVQLTVTDDERHHPGLWIHTRGMRKFARPELQIKHVPGDFDHSNRALHAGGKIINGIAAYLAGGAVLEGGQTMQLASLGDATITFIATPDDSDTARHFNNAALEIRDYDAMSDGPRDDASRLLQNAVTLAAAG
jgi:hypothetical protein